MTILVLTERQDVTADAVVDELNHRGADVWRYDTAEFPTASTLAATLTEHGWDGQLAAGHRCLDLRTVTAVWWRRPTEFRVPDHWSGHQRAYAIGEARAGLLGVLASLPARWVNHPAADSAANYKPRQLAVAARVGLDVPRTIITSDVRQAQAFIGDGEVIYKPMSGGVRAEGRHWYVPTTPMRAGDVDASIAGTAHLLQERIDKMFEVRLTVIGPRMFPIAIHAHSDAARQDYRTDYPSLTYARIELPAIVEKGVRALMDEFGLCFGALDFAIGHDGRWRFLEINATGQWHWLTRHTDAPMVEAMADVLQGITT
jgi:ATP-grasp ribosomal peptide maturase